jgi:hypothetical protein
MNYCLFKTIAYFALFFAFTAVSAAAEVPSFEYRVDENGQSSMHVAAEEGNVADIRVLLAVPDIDVNH